MARNALDPGWYGNMYRRHAQHPRIETGGMTRGATCRNAGMVHGPTEECGGIFVAVLARLRRREMVHRLAQDT